jgi:hypothetical protein
MQLFAGIMAGLVGVYLLVNGIFMLVSPRAWFRLPYWLSAIGSLRQEKHSGGWGAVKVRTGGAAIMVILAWVIYQTFFAHR